MSEESKKIPEEVTATAEAAASEVAAVTNAPVPAPDFELHTLLSKYGDADAMLPELAKYGLESVDDLSMLTEEELVGAGMQLLKARRLLSDLHKASAAKEVADAATKAPAATMFTADWNMVLPAPSTEDSFLKALRTGGVLKVGDSTYEAALRVFLADKCGLYRVPEMLSSAIETYADESEEPVPESFWKLRRNITRRDYSDLFSAIDGLDGSFATKKRREEFLRRMRDELCPAIREAYVALDGWYKSELAASSNPAALMQAVSGMMTGSAIGMGMNHTPTDSVLDAANTLKDKINRVFRGTSAPVAAAMANDAMEIAKFLDDASLPAFVGVPNREMMLKKLGINISANYARLEQNLVRFVLSYVKFEEAAGNELVYLNALWTLGTLINWEELGITAGGSGVTTLGGRIGTL